MHEHGLDTDELAHARSHAATLPAYVQRGERPTIPQILAFGAAGGLVPCPAAVTVMLLAISVNRSGNGLIMVLGFSIGLAITLVGNGLAVVMGLNALGSHGRFAWFSRRAPVISAAVVVLSGVAALVIAVTINSENQVYAALSHSIKDLGKCSPIRMAQRGKFEAKIMTKE